MNMKILVVGLISVVTVVGAGAVAAIILINNETPVAVNTASTANIQETKDKEKEELNGWKEEKGNWYFYKDNEKQKNWVQDKDLWYFLGNDGKMRTGWIKDKDEWYYMNEDGTMAINMTVDGCYIGNDGTIEDTPKYVNHENTSQSSNNNILINSPDQVLDIIRKNDSVYLDNTQREIASEIPGSYIKLFYCGDDDEYISMTGEQCYGVELFVTGPEAIDNGDEINYYLVGKYTGNVYILPHEGTYNAYQIKNNQIVKTIDNGGKDWR